MKAYLPFGDWSEDGHRYCDKVLVSINSMGQIFLKVGRKIIRVYQKIVGMLF